MTFDQHANFAFSSVQSGSGVIGSSSATSLTIASSGDLPNPSSGQYNITVWPAGQQPSSANAEIMRVTAKSGTTLTVTRAQEGTSALSGIAAGYQVALTMTSKLLTDIETAAGLALIQKITVTTAQALLDFTSIPGTFSHLQLVLSVRGTKAATVDTFQLQVNGDTGAHYSSQRTASFQTSNDNAQAGVTTAQLTMGSVSAGTAPTSVVIPYTITIPSYANASMFKSLNAQGGYRTGSGGGNFEQYNLIGFWDQAAAITRLTFSFAGGNFEVGSVGSLYGLA